MELGYRFHVYDKAKPAAAAAAQSAFASAHPYTYVQLADLLDDTRLLAVRQELSKLHRTFKETDLFKLYQTGDLGNLDRSDPTHAAALPQTLALRDALYSDAFRAFVRRVTGHADGHSAILVVPQLASLVSWGYLSRTLAALGIRDEPLRFGGRPRGPTGVADISGCFSRPRLRSAHRTDRLLMQRVRARKPLALPRRRHRHALRLVHPLPLASGAAVGAAPGRGARALRHR